MDQRTLEITNISAKDLNKVNLISKMEVYVVVSIAGDNSNQPMKSPVDKLSGNNPTWNFFTANFDINEEAVQQNRLSLVFKLKSDRVLGDKEIGEVHVPIKVLMDSDSSFNAKKLVSYQVVKPDGRPKGMLSFSYQFSGDANKVVEPVMAYPPPTEATTKAGIYPMNSGNEVPYYSPQPAQVTPVSVYPPPQAAQVTQVSVYPPPQVAPVAGYAAPAQYVGCAYPQQQAYGGYPPQQPGGGYGYPPPQQGYGYPPQVVEAPRKNSNSALGIGVGVLGGALGGMVLEEIIEDVAGNNNNNNNNNNNAYDEGSNDANNYDAGYDEGYNDANNYDNYDGGYNDGGYDGGYADGGSNCGF